VVPDTFHDFFVGSAGVAGALIGLLFVSLSVSPEKLSGALATTEYQIRAGAAFSALVNTLVLALVGLLPGANLSVVSSVLAAAGLASTAGLIVVLWREHTTKIGHADRRMLGILVLLYALQFANGWQMGNAPKGDSGFDRLGGLAILFFVFSITRSWQLVGARHFSLNSAMVSALEGAARRVEQGVTGEAGQEQPPASPGAGAGQQPDTGEKT
jgi:hypothetical protein